MLKHIIGFSMIGIVLAYASIVSAACVQESAGTLTSVLTWQTTDTVDPVTVFRSTTSGSGYVSVGTAPAGVLTFTDKVPAPTGTITYYYVVEAISPQAGPSANSNEACKTFFGVPPVPVLSIQ